MAVNLHPIKRGGIRIIVQLPAIHQQLVALEICDAMREASADDIFRHIVSTLSHTSRHAHQSEFDIRQG